MNEQINNSTLTDKVQQLVVTFPQMVQKRYNIFRISHTGISEGNFHHLCLSGVEIYGFVSE